MQIRFNVEPEQILQKTSSHGLHMCVSGILLCIGCLSVPAWRSGAVPFAIAANGGWVLAIASKTLEKQLDQAVQSHRRGERMRRFFIRPRSATDANS